jgi:formamidopyrimidine-DNA glycosylase
MPELPEVETVRRGLAPLLEGARIKGVELRRAGLRAAFPKGFANTLKGAKIGALRRRAKYILADLDNGHVWLTHLGMTGSFREIGPKEAFSPEAHDHVIVTLANGARLVFNDPRRFGAMDVFALDQEGQHPSLKALGPEPLGRSFNGSILKARLLGKKPAIKVALLDQSIVAGIGNIYASETLFRAGIDPQRPAGKITEGECDLLARAIKIILKAAIASGGSTLRNYRKVDGNTGFFQHRFEVYDRAGGKCRGCTCKGKSSIQSLTQAGRTTFFCPVKQR